ncbi:MAG: hypothetical protein REI11_16455, partial [Patulibacter sp.]|nr:hypothetical protein [Patulibacter sp.]
MPTVQVWASCANGRAGEVQSALRMTSIDTTRTNAPATAAERPVAPSVPAPHGLGRTLSVLGVLPAPLLVLADVVAVLAGALLPPGDVALPWRLAVAVAVFVGLSWQHTHRSGTGRLRPTSLWQAITVGGLAATVALLAVRSLTPDGPAAPNLLGIGLFATGTTLILRTVLQFGARRARRHGAGTVPTLIVGAGIVGRQLERRMRAHPELGFWPVGFLDDDPSPFGQLDGGDPAIILGPTAALPEVVERSGARHVVFSFTRAPDSEVLPLLRECQRAGIDVSVMPRLFENVNGRIRVEQLAGLPLLALRQTNPRSWQFTVKHASDRVIAAFLLVVLSPVLAALGHPVRLALLRA